MTPARRAIVFAPQALLPEEWRRLGDGPLWTFNPALLRDGDGWLMAVRVVGDDQQRRISLCRLDARFRLVHGSQTACSDHIVIPPDAAHARRWFADPRLYRLDGRVFLYWNTGWHEPANVQFLQPIDTATLLPDGPSRELVLDSPRRPIEKNWSFFGEGQVHAVYDVAPHRVLTVGLDGSGPIHCAPAHESVWNADAWAGAHGALRGGAPPARWGDSYLSIIHSPRHSDDGVVYVAAAYTFSAQPPFAPLLGPVVPLPLDTPFGPERLQPRLNSAVHHAVYPSGLAVDGDAIVVSYGINDERCAIAVLSADEVDRTMAPLHDAAPRLRIHLGHHFYGAGNLGDDLMLDGFLTALRDADPLAVLTCCCPHDLASQQRRFPSIDWRPYTEAARHDAIARADVWLGVGGSPVQSDGGDWSIDHLVGESRLCAKAGVPMWFVGIGVNNGAALARPELVDVLRGARGIWTRDAGSLRAVREAVGGAVPTTLGADFAHIALSGLQTGRAERGSLGLVLHSGVASVPSPSMVDALIARTAARPAWLVQEVRALPNSERALFDQLPSSVRDTVQLCEPDYQAATVPALLDAWPMCETVVSGRYHAALIAAWRGARIVLLATNDKLRFLADDLSLPIVAGLEAVAHESALDLARSVPVIALHERAGRARTTVRQWREAVGQAGARATRPRPDQQPHHEPSAPPAPRQLMMVSADSLGDLVLREPLCRLLLDSGFEVTVAGRPASLALLPYIDRRLRALCVDLDPYHVTDPEHTRTVLRQAVDDVAASGCTALLCPSFNRTVVDEMLLAHNLQLHRLGFAGPQAAVRLEHLFPDQDWSQALSTLFTATAPIAERTHEGDKYRALLESVFGIVLPEYRPRLYPDAAALRTAQEALARVGLAPGRYVVSCPLGTTNVAIKAVPAAITVAVTRALEHEEGLRTLFIGVEQEREPLETLARACTDAGAAAAVWVGGIADTGTLLGLIASARLYMGGDTGPMHMAAALDVPVAGVFGGGTFPRFLPLIAHRFIAMHELDCYGCGWHCRFDEPHCLTRIEPHLVVAGVRALLRQTRA